MKYLDEYRDSGVASGLTKEIAKTVTRPWVLMEVCGGQTHSIVRYGIDRMIPECIELVHGPGCPVCVTSLEMIDKAHAIASHPDVIFTSFGDMLRVPGSRGDLLTLKSRGADVRVVYSPLDAVQIARDNPGQESCLLRDRLRDHRAGQRDGDLPREARRREKLLDADFSCAGSAGDGGDPAGTGESRAGISRPGARLRRGWIPRIRIALRALSRSYRYNRFRADRFARRNPHDRAAARSWPRRGRESVRSRGLARRQSARNRSDLRSLRGRRPQVARSRFDSKVADTGSATNIASTTPKSCSRWTRSQRASPNSASAD